MPPIVVSMINLKGGVGKTTTTVQIAECLVSEFGKKVLVIDLDPQTNATIALIDQTRWSQLNRDGKTIAQLFRDKIDGTDKFDLHASILSGVSNLGLPGLHLLASSIDLVDIQDRFSDLALKTGNPMQVVKNAVAGTLERFDYVLIDCPPNLGFITQNGIEISDFYLIPTIPDTLSTYGMPQIVRKIKEAANQRGLTIRCLGMVATKCDQRSSVHQQTLGELPSRFSDVFDQLRLPRAPFFTTRIPQSNAFANAVEVENTPTTFKQKWGTSTAGGNTLHQHVTELTKEFMGYAQRRS